MVEKLIKDVHREKRTSKNAKEYQMLVITFHNGYKMEVFLSNEQQYILTDVPLQQ